METNAKTMECIDSNSSCSWSLPVASSDVLEWVVNEGHIWEEEKVHPKFGSMDQGYRITVHKFYL